MKTKVLLLMAILALIVYSCTSDREEEVQNPVSKKIDMETIKANNNGETSKVSDSVDLPDHQLSTPSTGLDPTNPINPNENEGGDPKDVPLPPRR